MCVNGISYAETVVIEVVPRAGLLLVGSQLVSMNLRNNPRVQVSLATGFLNDYNGVPAYVSSTGFGTYSIFIAVSGEQVLVPWGSASSVVSKIASIKSKSNQMQSPPVRETHNNSTRCELREDLQQLQLWSEVGCKLNIASSISPKGQLAAVD